MILKSPISYFVFILFILVSQACKKQENKPDNHQNNLNCRSSFIPKASGYQVVGFYPFWKEDIMPVSDIQWDKLTRIVYAFAIPNKDGTINSSFLDNTRQLVDSAHAHGVEIYYSIGGGGTGSDNFPVMATNEDSRNRFIGEVSKYIFENCLDGVDIDWEHWTGYATNTVIPAESEALVTLLKDLKAQLAPFNLHISIDLDGSDWGGKHFLDEITGYVDHLQVMSYDFSGPWSPPGPHSSFEDAIGSGNDINSTGLAYWVNYRGWPKEHVLLGVPFYGRDFDNEGGEYIDYSQIIDLFPDAYLMDQVNNIYYNGISTIARKTQYVVDNKFSGIMIWEITQDTPVDSISLLSSIQKIFRLGL